MQCLGVVLAGGQSSRMGQNKATLMRHAESMLSFSRDLLMKTGVDDVVISGDNNGGIADIIAQAGPVAGIYSVLKQTRAHALLILPVDLPLMTVDSLLKLKQAGQLAQRPTHYLQHPLPLYLPINGLVEQFLQQACRLANSKGPSFKQLFTQCGEKIVQPPKNNELFNANTPEEWDEAQRIIFNSRSQHV